MFLNYPHAGPKNGRAIARVRPRDCPTLRLRSRQRRPLRCFPRPNKAWQSRSARVVGCRDRAQGGFRTRRHGGYCRVPWRGPTARRRGRSSGRGYWRDLLRAGAWVDTPPRHGHDLSTDTRVRCRQESRSSPLPTTLWCSNHPELNHCDGLERSPACPWPFVVAETVPGPPRPDRAHHPYKGYYPARNIPNRDPRSPNSCSRARNSCSPSASRTVSPDW